MASVTHLAEESEKIGASGGFEANLNHYQNSYFKNKNFFH